MERWTVPVNTFVSEELIALFSQKAESEGK
jgi:hypothetical protein